MAEECRYCHRRLDPARQGDAVASPVNPDHAKYFPFCSDRCKMAELGLWFQDKYALSRPLDEVADEAGPKPPAGKGPAPEPKGGPPKVNRG